MAKYSKEYPELASAKCECAGKRAHSKKCGCMSDEFLARAKSNHFSALKQCGNDPKEYANRMRILGEYHSRDIHKWIGDDGKEHTCPWHPQEVCSCGKCDKGGKNVGDSGSGESGSGVASGSGVSGSGAAPGSGELGSGVSSGSGVAGEDSDSGDSEDRGDSEESEDSDDSDGEYNPGFSCSGKPYRVRGKVLTCDLHSLLYKIECDLLQRRQMRS